MAKRKLILNRYRPLEAVGSGGFGTVQLVWDTVMQRKVALKCIELSEFEAMRARLPETGGGGEAEAPIEGDVLTDPPLPWNDVPETARADGEAADSEEFLPERTLANIPGLDEARAVATLNDPNIVAVYDFQVEGTTAYLSMEYVEGATLTALLRDYRDDLTLDAATAVFEAVAHALEVAHENGVLHLDIKPDNVLVDRSGQVKVTDFGLARLADANGFGVAGGGTIGYMPLEQMRQEELDERCDEWALAALSYEMLVGENPFLAPDLPRAEAAVEDAELVLPSLCWEELGEGIDDVLFFALDPDREERYDSVAEFADEMSPYLFDAKRGKKELAALVARFKGGEEAEEGTPAPLPREPRAPREPLVERVSDRMSAALARVWAVLGAAVVGGVALAGMPFDGAAGTYVFWGGLVLCAGSAAVLPHVGALVAYAVMAVGLLLCGAPVLAVLLAFAVGAWWYFVGRGGKRTAATAFAQPVFGAVGFAPFAPVMAGAFLPVLPAVATAAFAAFTALVCAGFGSLDLSQWNAVAAAGVPSGSAVQANVLALVARPATWVVMASWVAAAALFSLCCTRGTRAFDVVGAVLAGTILVAGACAATWAASEGVTWMPNPQTLVASLLPGVCGIVASAARVSDRVRWDDPLHG